MSKMKVIDLLNKLHNEEIPNGTKIKRWGKTYILDFPNLCGIYEENCEKHNIDTNLFGTIDDICALDGEIEIIEEPKKIEKITFGEDNIKYSYQTTQIRTDVNVLANKINEIIDYINKGN